MTEGRLTPEQYDRFVHNGFIVLRKTILQEILDKTLEVVAETVTEDLTNLEAMIAGPEDRHYWNDLSDMAPFKPLNEILHTYAEELAGIDQLHPPSEFTQVAVRYPTGEYPSTPGHSLTAHDGNPHVDIFQGPGELHPFTIGATTYLDDVHPCGGGLTVWPGTHWRIAEHLSEHGIEDNSNENVEDVLGSRAAPFEVCGSAGMVILWHNLLVHTGGCNLGQQARIAAFTRFVRHDEEETSHEAVKSPFKYWRNIDK